jgi:hypothetical protein
MCIKYSSSFNLVFNYAINFVVSVAFFNCNFITFSLQPDLGYWNSVTDPFSIPSVSGLSDHFPGCCEI